MTILVVRASRKCPPNTSMNPPALRAAGYAARWASFCTVYVDFLESRSSIG